MDKIVPQPDFREIVDLIRRSRTAAFRAVNAELIDLYWNIGEYLSRRIADGKWGDAVIENLAEYIQQNETNARGFSDKNL